jgi:GT2 family glycosyltransferase
MNTKPPLVYIILLTYNMRDDAIRCLRSLTDLTYPHCRVVLVDNASSDGVEEAVRAEFPDLTFIQTGANSGYTGGNNRGIEHALSAGADYVMILNPDTTLANPGFLEQMIAYLETNPDVGIAGPRVFAGEPGVVQNTVLFAPGLWRSVAHWARYRLNPRFAERSADEVVDAEALNGVCLLIRAACLNEIGLFDENIFMYIEDAEMDYRAHRHGWKVRYLPIDGVIHHRGQEGCQMTGMVNFLLKRNAVYFLCKTGRRLDAWGYAVMSLGLTLARAVSPFKRESFSEGMRFCGRLAAAYREILGRRELGKSFGPPYS